MFSISPSECHVCRLLLIYIRLSYQIIYLCSRFSLAVLKSDRFVFVEVSCSSSFLLTDLNVPTGCEAPGEEVKMLKPGISAPPPATPGVSPSQKCFTGAAQSSPSPLVVFLLHLVGCGEPQTSPFPPGAAGISASASQ